jgi:hypothetical protein
MNNNTKSMGGGCFSGIFGKRKCTIKGKSPTRVEQIRNLVRNGVLKNINNNNKNNTRSRINSMPESKLRSLARSKGIRIPKDLSKPK